MAKKSRTPAPPRRPVQAPRVRTDSRKPADVDRRRRLILYAIAGSGLAALAAVMIGFSAFGGSGGAVSNTRVNQTLRAAGCTVKHVPATKSALHIGNPNQKVKYNTFPPTSGRHYVNPGIWGFYGPGEAVNPTRVVHNQEHGGVTIWYGSGVSARTREQLRKFYDDSPNGMLVSPLPKLGKRVALTAWTVDVTPDETGQYASKNGQGHVATCSRFDEKGFAAFRDAYRGKGPERFPVEFNRPGT